MGIFIFSDLFAKKLKYCRPYYVFASNLALSNQQNDAEFVLFSSDVKLIDIGVKSLEFDSPGRSNRTQRPATAATFLRKCVAQAINRQDGPRSSPRTSA